jgi:hypothetical protein
MLKGYTISMVSGAVVNLSVMVCILLPGSLLLFVLMVRKGRKEGTLMQY